QEDPGGAPVALAAQEVEAAAHRSGADFGVGLHFHEHLPALVPALQLAHVLDAFLPWKGGAHGAVSWLTSHRVRCPRDSCQLDSGSHMHCRACGTALAAPAKFCHKCGAAVSRPHGTRAAGWRAGLPWSVAGAALGALIAVVALRASGGGMRDAAGGRRDASPDTLPPPRIPPPAISQMSPAGRATRPHNRVITLHSQGKADSAGFFLPMALQAYAMLPALDVDARYHIGGLDLTGG